MYDDFEVCMECMAIGDDYILEDDGMKRVCGDCPYNPHRKGNEDDEP